MCMRRMSVYDVLLWKYTSLCVRWVTFCDVLLQGPFHVYTNKVLIRLSCVEGYGIYVPGSPLWGSIFYKDPPCGTLNTGSTHHFTIASSTLTTWFPRLLPYMVNRMVFKVNRVVQVQPWVIPTLFYSSLPSLRAV
jgi:hypothetical protein